MTGFIFQQAHDSSVRTMVWSHNDQWMVTGDTGGFVKYWQTNMNNVKLFQAHKDPVRGLRYPHLCHRPLSIIIIITPTTTHPCHQSLLLWETHPGYRRSSLPRRSCFPGVNSVFHSWRGGCVGRPCPPLTCFPVVMVRHKGFSSASLTPGFNDKSKPSHNIFEILHCILIQTHLQLLLINLNFSFFILCCIYFFHFGVFVRSYSYYHYYIEFCLHGKFLSFHKSLISIKIV